MNSLILYRPNPLKIKPGTTELEKPEDEELFGNDTIYRVVTNWLIRNYDELALKVKADTGLNPLLEYDVTGFIHRVFLDRNSHNVKVMLSQGNARELCLIPYETSPACDEICIDRDKMELMLESSLKLLFYPCDPVAGPEEIESDTVVHISLPDKKDSLPRLPKSR